MESNTPRDAFPGTYRLRRRRLTLALLAGLLAVSGVACDEDPVRPDPTLEPLVGDWDATSMIVTSRDDPPVSADLVALGARFFLNVQPSGQYTSSVTFLGSTVVELGELRVEDDRLIFDVRVSPTGTRVDTSTFTLDGDVLRFDGEATVDFGDEEGPEEADVEVTMVRVADDTNGSLRAGSAGEPRPSAVLPASRVPAPRPLR